MEKVEGKVAAILSRTSVAINRGSDQGVSKGDYFWLYTIIGPIIDPDTKEDLGTTWKVWGRIIVSIVEKRFCIAETEYEYRGSVFDQTALARLFGTTREQIQLPVNENQITGWITKIEIGCRARLEKRPLVEKKVETLPPKTTKELSPRTEEPKIESAEYYYNLFPVDTKVIETKKGTWLIHLKSFEKLPGRNELHYTLKLKNMDSAFERSLNLWGYREDFKSRSADDILTEEAMKEALAYIGKWVEETNETSGKVWLFVDAYSGIESNIEEDDEQ